MLSRVLLRGGEIAEEQEQMRLWSDRQLKLRRAERDTSWQQAAPALKVTRPSLEWGGGCPHCGQGSGVTEVLRANRAGGGGRYFLKISSLTLAGSAMALGG